MAPTGMIYDSRVKAFVPKPANVVTHRFKEGKMVETISATTPTTDDGSIIPAAPTSNPATWTHLSSGIMTPDIGVKGLGAYRTDKKGRVIANAAMTVRDSGDDSSRADAKVKESTRRVGTKTNPATSL